MTSLTERTNQNIRDNLEEITESFKEYLASISDDEFAKNSDRARDVTADFLTLLDAIGYSPSKDGIYLCQDKDGFNMVIPKNLSALVTSPNNNVPDGFTYLQFKNYAAVDEFIKLYNQMNLTPNQRISTTETGGYCIGGVIAGAIGCGIIAGGVGSLIGIIVGALGGLYVGISYIPEERFEEDKKMLSQHCGTALARTTGKQAMIDAVGHNNN